MDIETPNERNCVPIGRHYAGPLNLDLDKLLAGRLLIQGTSGAGKSATLRRIIEEAFEYMTTIIVDPEAEFANLAAHIGATTLHKMAGDGFPGRLVFAAGQIQR